MNTEKIAKESKVIMIAALIIGIVLFVVGTIFGLMEANIVSNNKAFIGLSFIPLSVALIYYVKLSKIKKSPQEMRSIIVYENDERLVALKNEVDAKAFKVLQGALFYAYMGYTLIVPDDIFESVGWWILLVLLFISFISKGIFFKIIMGKDVSKDDGE